MPWRLSRTFNLYVCECCRASPLNPPCASPWNPAEPALHVPSEPALRVPSKHGCTR
ncbi:hypothetical protein T492DRAFT_1104883 [Pavlovales sp. CCMP2436]|nr:hypothetical protein T492DRAFT_1104883 [Pavlovales sp. CCMP2436]